MSSPAMHEVIAWGLAVLMLGVILVTQVAKGFEMNRELLALFMGAITVMVARGTRGAGGDPPPPAVRAAPG